MEELYKIGLIVCIFLLITIVGLLGGFISSQAGAKELFDYLDHVGSFLGGIAGVATTGIAFAGVSAWKKQLIHGKKLEVIWEAQVSLRELNVALLNSAMLVSDAENTPGLAKFDNEREFAMARFQSAIAKLDKLVLGARIGLSMESQMINVLWANYRALSLTQKLQGKTVTPLDGVGAERYGLIAERIQHIERKLDVLRDRYS